MKYSILQVQVYFSHIGIMKILLWKDKKKIQTSNVAL